MSHYRLERRESLSDGVARIVSELTEEAIGHLEFPDGMVKGVHEARKTCKRVRGLARLVRPALDNYGEVNRTFRDAARELAPIRDAHAFLGTFDDVSATPAASSALEPIRGRFEARADDAYHQFEEETDRLDSARKLIEDGQAEADQWQIADDFASLAGGVERTYRRGRDAMEESMESGDVGDFHQWRKRVKYLWYQMQLLRNAAPSALRPLARRLHDLSDALGDAHDLALMVGEVATMDVPDSSAEAFRVVASGYRLELEQRALSLGRRLYAEESGAFVARIEGYWKAWEKGDELAAGELADISPTSDRPILV